MKDNILDFPNPFFELEDNYSTVVELDKICAIKSSPLLFKEDIFIIPMELDFHIQINSEVYYVRYAILSSKDFDLFKKTQKKAQDKYNYIKKYLLNKNYKYFNETPL